MTDVARIQRLPPSTVAYQLPAGGETPRRGDVPQALAQNRGGAGIDARERRGLPLRRGRRRTNESHFRSTSFRTQGQASETHRPPRRSQHDKRLLCPWARGSDEARDELLNSPSG